MSSAENHKQRSARLDLFKRLNAAAFRAVSRQHTANVQYGAGQSRHDGEAVKLPPPPLDADEAQIKATRGAADLLAMRLKHHDADIHARRQPQGDLAPHLYEALENARVEALGGQYLLGVQENMHHALEKQYRQMGYHRIEEKDPATMAEATRLLVREYLTGTAPPESARHIVDMWRNDIEDKLSHHIPDLMTHMDDQEKYAKTVTSFLRDMDMDPGDDVDVPDNFDDNSTDDNDDALDDQQNNQTRQDNEQDVQQGEAQDETPNDRQEGEGESEGEEFDEDGNLDDEMVMATQGDDMPGEQDMRERPEHDLSNVKKEKFYKIYSEKYD